MGRPYIQWKASDQINKGIGEICVSVCSWEIRSAIKKEFEYIHLSHNLVDTMFVETSFGLRNRYDVINIPAVTYNINKYRKEKVISYQPYKGSYAFKVNRTGGFSKTHHAYIDRSIIEGVEEFCDYVDNKTFDGYDITVKRISWRL